MFSLLKLTSRITGGCVWVCVFVCVCQVQDLLCASEKIDEENKALRALISDQRQNNQVIECSIS